MPLAILSLPGTLTSYLVIVRTGGGGSDARSGLIRRPEASSLMLLGMLSIGAAYAGIVRQTSEYALGASAESEGRVGCAEGMDGEEVFFVTFVPFFVSMIVSWKEKGNTRGRKWSCVVID